jgi:hypothetical protein
VSDFIAKYALDDAQRGAAASMLQEMKERAVAHRDRHRTEVTQLERRLAAGRPEDADRVAGDLQRLYGPIDDMFRELQQRLQRIPTQAQQRASTQPVRNAAE